MRVKISLSIQLAPWCARSRYIIHMWLICSHVLRLPQSLRDGFFLSASMLPEVSRETSWNSWLFSNITPVWSRAMHMGQKCYVSWERNSSLASGGFFVPLSWRTKIRRETEGGRQLLLTSWPPPTHSLTLLVVFNSQKHARPLWHVSFRMARV